MSHAYLWEKARLRGSKGQVSEAQGLACVRTAEDSVAGAEWVRGKTGSERYCRERDRSCSLSASVRTRLSLSVRGSVLSRKAAWSDLWFTGKKSGTNGSHHGQHESSQGWGGGEQAGQGLSKKVCRQDGGPALQSPEN